MKTQRANSALAVLVMSLLASAGTCVGQFSFLNQGHGSNYMDYADGVAISGNYAYIARGNLFIYDISNPTNVVNVATTNTGAGTVFSVAVSGNYAYMGVVNNGLRIYDVSNPAKPFFVGSTNNVGGGFGVALAGNYCYLANGGDGLRIYDVSNPANPLCIARTNNGGLAQGVAISGNYAYLANDNDGLRIYNISDPAHPINIAHTNSSLYVEGLAISGNYAYLATDTGLHIYNVSNPALPSLVSRTNNSTPGGVGRNVAVFGSYAFLANNSDGLRMYDVSNPAKPAPVAHLTGALWAVAVSGNYVYVPIWYSYLQSYLVAPQLGIGLTNAQSTVVSWPAPLGPGFGLQRNTNLSTANWLDVTNSPTTTSNRAQVILPASAKRAFYRLKLL